MLNVETVLPDCCRGPIDDGEAGSSTEGRLAGRALRSDEETFIDLPNSPLFFSNEAVVIST